MTACVGFKLCRGLHEGSKERPLPDNSSGRNRRRGTTLPDVPTPGFSRFRCKPNGRTAEHADDRERLIFRIGKLEECLPEERDDYETYTREDKVSLLKSHLLERAYARDGKASADYDDVIWGVFDGEPSRDHAYTLMELAAQADGFHYNTSRRPREVRVDLDETKAEVDLSHATTNEQRGGD